MTRRRFYKVIVFILITVSSLLYLFYSKHYIRYSACYKIKTLKTPSYPDAYRFINTKEDLEYCINLLDHTSETNHFLESFRIDFKNYTYVIVFSAPVKEMYYSIKTTIFDDKSPSYANAVRYNKKCVFINYYQPTGYIYLYEIKKDLSLSGFDGI